MAFDLGKIKRNWTLFLDRDGVINYENPGTYVRNWEEFKFYPGAPENIAFFNTRFQRVLLATNQRGITRGVMTLQDLEHIHEQMLSSVEQKGGRIDKIYFCLDMDADSPCRKPNPGMALQAALDFPEIDLTRSVMVGNNISDMEFGRNAGMVTVFLRTTSPEMAFPHESVDAHYRDLNEFAQALQKS
ncbi:MAG: HAD family hydrolase [Bacteroidota bacterium]|nr:HAD family hydrolase [Bacteroidota bacterium]MDP4213870.1 HAD family hydrolase [Bacteroidota bacterium]MDP4251756.1 HAD family hydrolase [Bacteroidota bacterium]